MSRSRADGTMSSWLLYFRNFARVMLNISSFTFNYRAQKFTIFIYLSLLMTNSAVLILAVCRTPVTYELSKMTFLSMSSRSSVDSARPVFGRSWVRDRFLSGTQIFLCPTLVSCWIFHLSLSNFHTVSYIIWTPLWTTCASAHLVQYFCQCLH